MSDSISFVKALNTRQRLYRCSRPVVNCEGESSEYLIMSNNRPSMYCGKETMCFLADKTGEIISYSEVACTGGHTEDNTLFDHLCLKAVPFLNNLHP